MKNKLRDCILKSLLNKDEEEINWEKYGEVISYISSTNNLEPLYVYIVKCCEYKLNKSGLPIDEEHIISILNTSYCIEKSYEYICFLKNNHEYMDDYAR